MGLSNYVPNSRLAQPGVCTSTTRPASPFEGQVIYETDTNRVLVYDASAWVMIADTDTPPALQLIKTQTIGTSVGSVDVSSCFSSEFSNYRIMWDGITASNDTYMGCRVLVGSTLNAANVQGNTFYVATAASGGLTNANLANASIIECGNATNDSHNSGWVEIQQPNAAQYTYFQSCSSDNNYLRWCNFVLTNTTQYDGFRLLPGSGTLTGGTIRVYGYRNS